MARITSTRVRRNPRPIKTAITGSTLHVPCNINRTPLVRMVEDLRATLVHVEAAAAENVDFLQRQHVPQPCCHSNPDWQPLSVDSSYFLRYTARMNCGVDLELVDSLPSPSTLHSESGGLSVTFDPPPTSFSTPSPRYAPSPLPFPAFPEFYTLHSPL